MTLQDVVLIFCTVKGQQNGRYVEMTDARKVYAGPFRGQTCSAIQTTTAIRDRVVQAYQDIMRMPI